MNAPPIPATCTHLSITSDGLIKPWANVALSDGGCDFRSHHNTRWLACWQRHLCQVCGQPARLVEVLLCGPRQLKALLFDEPPLHPECARYVTQACPMVAGQRDHYRTGPVLAHRSRGGTCTDPGCDCGGWVPTPGLTVGPGGGLAHEWYAIYVRGYSLAARPDGTITGGICTPDQVIRVRLVSEPGRAYWPWLPVNDWAERYRSPETAR